MAISLSDEMQVVIELKNGKPVELLDFANSMIGFGNQYSHYLHQQGVESVVPDAKLYIKQIKEGSIIATLAALAPVVVPMFDQVNVVHDFALNITAAINWLIGKDGEKPSSLDKPTLQNISKIVRPVVEDSAGQLNIGTLVNNGTVNLQMSINSTEAKTIQDSANKELALLNESVAGPHENVAFYWDQASNTVKSRAADRGRIESIYPGAVKVHFQDDALKRTMLLDEPHPFKKAFIVNVIVESVENKPVLYKITSLTDVIDRP